jgi:hypothetical protein
MWIAVANSSSPHSCAPAMIVRPDGSIRTARRNQAGMICHKMPDNDLGMLYNDKMMKLSEEEVFHNGNISSHPRILNRQSRP